MRFLISTCLVGVLCVSTAAPVAAADVTIKLATLVPDGSVWDKALKSMGSTWKRESQGRVELRIYPGGVAGDEPDVLRKMRIGQLHAGTITVSGLIDIDPAFEALAIPFFYDSYEEFFHVLRAVEPEMKRRARAKGYELIQWGHAGWAQVFSTEAIETVEDLRRLKLFVSAGDGQMLQWWKREGFQPVALSMTDIMTGLQTGMIDVIPTTPLAALSLQWFRQTPHMMELGLAPLVGATVVSSRIWNRISDTDKKAMLAAAVEMERQLEREIPKQDATAIAEMSKRGLTVHTAANVANWEELAKEFETSLRGVRIPAEAFDLVLAAREAYRRESAAGDAR